MVKTEDKLKKLNILIVTHSRATGFSQILRDWIITRAKTLSFIDHPLLSSINTYSSHTFYKEQQMVVKTYPRASKISLFIYVQDFLYTIFFVVLTGKTYDIAIGIDNLNTFSLLLLRRFGYIKKVVYHTVDYTPTRFQNSILNKIYHFIDAFCCYRANMIWNSSSRINEGRIKKGISEKRIAKTIVTPDGSNFDPKKRLPINKIDRKKIVFLGHLREGMGLELLISSFKEVLDKIKDAKLLIIGDGPLFHYLKKRVQQLGISSSVEFTGFINKHEDVDEYIRYGSIGVAPFEPKENSIEYYSDVGKPKAYLAAGLPVVITKIPEIAFEIQEKKAGIAIDYNKKELVDALLLLLQNEALYKKYRENAVALSRKYAWPNIFEEAFKQTFKYFNIQ